jgi:hypothetical protein
MNFVFVLARGLYRGSWLCMQGVMKLGVLNGRVQYPEPCTKQGTNFSPAYCKLIKGMLTVDPSKRLRLGAVRSRIAAMLATN